MICSDWCAHIVAMSTVYEYSTIAVLYLVCAHCGGLRRCQLRDGGLLGVGEASVLHHSVFGGCGEGGCGVSVGEGVVVVDGEGGGRGWSEGGGWGG
jgi:hypothetical protein